MDYNINIIHKDPFGIFASLNMPWLLFYRLAHMFLNGVDDGIYLGIGSPVAYYKIVTNGIFYLSEVQNLDVLTFYIFNSLNYLSNKWICSSLFFLHQLLSFLFRKVITFLFLVDTL